MQKIKHFGFWWLGKPIRMIFLIIAILAILLIMARAKEDYWYQDANGKWVKHGNPASSAPNE